MITTEIEGQAGKYLTLTRVVFEFVSLIDVFPIIKNLTLTRVVFECKSCHKQ